MLKNYFKVTWRNFVRQKVYSLLNVSGLAIGLACFILTFLYIQDELSYDRFHTKSDRTYRVLERFESEGVGEHSASLPFPAGSTLKNDFPRQVEHSVRLFNFQSPTLALSNKPADKAFNESKIFFADSSFLDVFDFQLLAGNRKNVLDQPNSILITPSMAKKYFADEDPMGKLLEFQGSQNLKVTGILEDAPLNAHFQYDFIISFSSLKHWYNGTYPGTWYWNPCWTYIVLEENTDQKQFEKQLPAFVQKYFPGFISSDVELELQPLHNIHLYSKLDYEIQANSEVKSIYIFGAIAFFVLVIATINFINLSTARATKRAKEVGVRKSLGSKKSQLVIQFVLESILMTLLATLIAFLVVLVVLPSFNLLVEKEIELTQLLKPGYILWALLLSLSVGFFSGFYPAFILSSFKTVSVLKSVRLKAKGLNFRKILVTSQFSISIFLIAGTIVAIDQFQLLQDQDVGFDREHVIMVPVIRSPMGQHYESFRNKALQSAHISSVTGVEEIVGAKHQVQNYRFEGMEISKPFPRFSVLHDFTGTMDIELVAGRDYSREYLTDDSLAYVVNESMVKAMNWHSPEEAVGKQFYYKNELKGKIVGVVRDYNFVSKHHPIGPLVLDLNTKPAAFNLFIKYLAIKVDHRNLNQAIADVKKAWTSTLPNRPFDFFFLEDRLNQSYSAEQKLSKITVIFSVLAIGVACLGLFGLATFNIERRTKEIGLRKVLGIKTSQILILLSKEFIYLILIAFAVSIPTSYFLLERWLSEFAYRINLQIWPFVIAGIITFIVSMITILYHALKASFINPVTTLKYE
ncbi:ABC transporter permease [Fulvivirga sp. M361]|uniref:ABC transporter permease n=1 Tax=Fulvivirga sp. M361 TaxID=2594266 RepID=UPI001625A3A2|nr:ABC transporter permease [Fulvivirga sp. M361]